MPPTTYQKILLEFSTPYAYCHTAIDTENSNTQVTIQEANTAFETLTKSNCQGDNLYQLLPQIDPALVEKALSTQEKRSFDYPDLLSNHKYMVEVIPTAPQQFALCFRERPNYTKNDEHTIELIQNSQEATLLIDGETFIACSDAAAHILGYTDKNALMNVHPGKLSPEYQEDGLTSMDKAKQTMEFAQTRGFHQFEWIHLKADGSPIPIRVSLVSISFRGQRAQYVHWQDLTAEKEQQRIQRKTARRMDAFINSQTSYILRTDLYGCYTFANDYYVKEFGWTHQAVTGKDLEGTNCLPSISSHHHERVQETVMKCLAAPGVPQRVEIDKPLKDGGYTTTLWNFVALPDENGNPEEMQCVGIDISYMKKAQAELERQKDEIYASMSTPITQLWDNILLLPLVGNMNAQRAREVISSALDKISKTQAKVFILDISGINIVDTSTANYFIHLAKAIKLMGCLCTISGITSSVAQTMVELGVNIGEIHTTGTLKTALENALLRTNTQLVNKK